LDSLSFSAEEGVRAARYHIHVHFIAVGNFISMPLWILIWVRRARNHFGHGIRFPFWAEEELERAAVGVPARSRGGLRRAS